MGTKDAPGNRPSLEQTEAEQHRVAHAAPYRADGVAACGDILYQHRIDGNADENEQALKAHGKQGLQIVLPGIAQLPIRERGNGDGR